MGENDSSPRAILGLDTEDNPFLNFYEKNTTVRISLNLNSSNNPSLLFTDEKANAAIDISALPSIPYIEITGEMAMLRLQNINKDKKIGLTLIDKEISPNILGSLGLEFYVNNKMVTSLSASQEQNGLFSALSLSGGNKEGVVEIKAGADATMLSLQSRKGNRQISLAQGVDGSMLAFSGLDRNNEAKNIQLFLAIEKGLPSLNFYTQYNNKQRISLGIGKNESPYLSLLNNYGEVGAGIAILKGKTHLLIDDRSY